MSPRRPKISCGRWRRCFAGEAGDERNLYFVAARSEKIQPVAGADYCIARPAAFVFAGARLRPRADVPTGGRQRELFAVHSARNHRDVRALYFRVFGNCAAMGPAVWIFERDAGGAGAAHSHHDRADARWSDGCGLARNIDHDRLSNCGIPTSELDRYSSWLRIHGDDCDCVCGTGDIDRIEPSGHAGVPVDYELPGAANFLFVRSAVFARQSVKGDVICDEPRSPFLRSRWIARNLERSSALRRAGRRDGAWRCGPCPAVPWGVALLEDRDLEDVARTEREGPQQGAGVSD